MQHEAISLIKAEHRALAAVIDAMTQLVRKAEQTGR